MNQWRGGHATRIAIALTVVVGVAASCRARGIPRPIPPAIDSASAAEVATGDSAAVRRALLRNIQQFQNAWRLAWQRSEVSRHGALQLAFVREDISMGLNGPDVRRFRAIRCSAGFTNDGALGLAQSTSPSSGLHSTTRTERNTNATITESMSAAARAMEAVSQQAQRAERSARDKSTVCPMWTPDSDYLPLDEGDNPDLSLMAALRPRLRRDRDSILARLDVAAHRFPGDTWIAGQRVRFALDHQETTRAARAADQCRGDSIACSALQAIVFERRGAMAQADSAFARVVALRRAPAAKACSDSLLLVVLDEVLQQRMERLPCSSRPALIDTLWWLADPLWSDAGNERFVAHHSRETWIGLRAAAGEDERFTWRPEGGGLALRSSIMRYGWPSHTYWGGRFLDEEISQAREQVRMEANPPYLAHEYSPGRTAFIPSASLLMQPFDSDGDVWAAQHAPTARANQWWPREHMRRLSPIVPMPQGQLALLRRDSSVIVGVAIDEPTPQRAPDPLEAPVVTMLASVGPNQTRVLARGEHWEDSTLRLSGHVRPLPFVLSVEVASRVPHEPWHRLRRGVRPPAALTQMTNAALAVSHPVLLRLPRRGASAPSEPDAALSQMMGTLMFSRNAPVALYWESYGFTPGDTVSVEIRIARRDENSALRSVGAALGLANARRDSVSITWREPEPGRQATVIAAQVPTVGRAISVDLRNLPPGQYALIVEMSRPNGGVARGERRVVIVE